MTEYQRVNLRDVPAFRENGWRLANPYVHIEALGRVWTWMVREVPEEEPA